MSNGRGDDGLLGCTVAGLATHDVRAASLLAQHGIDLCDDGPCTLAEACALHGVAADALCGELAQLGLDATRLQALSSPWWALDELCAVLVDCHHAYFRRVMDSIRLQLATAGDAEEPAAVTPLFDRLVDVLSLHLVKEEHLVFPAFAALAEARRARVPRPPGTSPHLLGPIRVMEEHHREIEALAAAIEAVTHGFAVGESAGPAWRGCCRDLGQFVHELRAHVQLENALLFPRALELEREWP